MGLLMAGAQMTKSPDAGADSTHPPLLNDFSSHSINVEDAFTSDAGWTAVYLDGGSQKVFGVVPGGNLPRDWKISFFTADYRSVGSTAVKEDGTFSFTTADLVTKVDTPSHDRVFAILKRDKDVPVAEVDVFAHYGGSWVVSLPRNAYFKVKLLAASTDLDAEIKIDGEPTGRTRKLISTTRGIHHLDAVYKDCTASLKKHGFFSFKAEKPEEIALQCGQKE
jgi:hypothetical protein